MEKREFNKDFSILRDEFEKRTGLKELVPFDYDMIVSPKQIINVKTMALMKRDDLEELIKSIPLIEDLQLKPYKGCDVKFCDIDPTRLNVSQTYLLDRKLLFFLNGFGKLYEAFCCKTISKLGPHYLVGEDTAGKKSLAIYLPPIVERREEEDLLIDGNHRSCICGRAGTSVVSIVVKNPIIEPPYTGIPWHTNIVSEKPPLEDRYRNFNPKLLKDFSYVGIDG